MNNVRMSITADQLIIRIDLKAGAALSKSGMSRVIATTNGNKPIPGTPAKIGLTIFHSRHAEMPKVIPSL